MRYRKIHILGAAGSGKSYIADLLSRTYGLSVFDLDDLFWDNRAGGETRCAVYRFGQLCYCWLLYRSSLRSVIWRDGR